MSQKLYVNGHIAALLQRHEEGLLKAERLTYPGRWKHIASEFEAYSLRRFLTQYCQERIHMLHRYDLFAMLFQAR